MTVKMNPMLNDSASVMEESKREIKKSAPAKKSQEEVSSTHIAKKPSDSQRIHQRIMETPVVNNEKVEAIKHKIANMEYALNPQRVADKMLALETEIFKTPKLSEK